ncbi:hypothetical protein [Lacinutrix jangbogonensis]|uniref:hypothetical protein n=1 Tax=Lacinutrix jangbogonensis TaxID=1469557 RepID=UPI00053EDDDF|nr:hypothetical protein [Lacinutrix jangbogonensis]
MIKKLKIIIGVFLLASVISYFILEANEKQFDRTQWNTSPLTRFKMAKSLMESDILYGKTKEEVISLLGNAIPSTLKGKDHLVYAIGTPPSFFEAKEEKIVVVFEDGKVINVIHLLQ